MILSVAKKIVPNDSYHFIGLSDCFEYFIQISKTPRVTPRCLCPEELSKSIQKEVIKADLVNAFDIISWQQGRPIRKYKILSDTAVIPPARATKNLSKQFFNRILVEKDIELLEAYWQILDQTNATARYIMSYRLLEAMAVEKGFGNNVEKLLSNYKIKHHTVKDRRNPKQKNIYIKHIRDKIHRTKNSYLFPIKAFTWGDKVMSRLLKMVVAEYLSRG